MTDHIDWTRLARYFAGECEPAEADEIRAWIEADPERQRLVEEMRAVWQAAETPSTVWDTPGSWHRLAARLHSRERRPRLAVVRRVWPAERYAGWAWTTRLTAIAVLAVLAVGGWLLWHSATGGSKSTVASAPPLRMVRTPLGQRARFQLADGSRVLLAAGSVLRYDTSSFGVSTRELRLEGRAHFVVAHDPRRPFLVHTARTVTEDLGTEFVITDYAEDAASEVVVASGTVAVRSVATDTTRPATVLTRGELVRLDTTGRATVRRGVDLGAQLAWTEGRLVFVDVPVGEVVVQLNRWYGTNVRLGDPALARHRFSASYLFESEATVVREVATAVGARVERRGNVVVLVPLSDRSREN